MAEKHLFVKFKTQATLDEVNEAVSEIADMSEEVCSTYLYSKNGTYMFEVMLNNDTDEEMATVDEALKSYESKVEVLEYGWWELQ